MTTHKESDAAESEVFDIESIEQISLSALLEAHRIHNNLGVKGTENVKKNQHGETATRGDTEAEKAIITVLKQFEIPIVIFSEEHGKVNISENPRYTATLDGIDGSGLYKKEFGVGRYGTMFSIYEGTDPTYDDYLFGGVMEHATARLFFAVKGKGAFVLENGVVKKVHSSSKTSINKTILIEADEYDLRNDFTRIVSDVFLTKLQEFQRNRIDSTAAHYADLTSGACDLVLEATRKGNLELAVGYPLTKEAGGVIVDMQGQSIGDRKFREFGQNEHTPFVAAANPTLAQNLLEYLNV